MSIIVENRITEIVANMPKIRINEDVSQSPSFGWGDRKELGKYLNLKGGGAYPLIWLLISPDNHTERGRLCSRDCEFVIATLESQKDLMNNERFEKSFDVVLNPVLEYLLQGLGSSSIARIENESWSVERRPDYSESDFKEKNDNYTIELWDALKLSCTVEFNNHCLKTIKWQTRNI